MPFFGKLGSPVTAQSPIKTAFALIDPLNFSLTDLRGGAINSFQYLHGIGIQLFNPERPLERRRNTHQTPPYGELGPTY
jgi:hypothetical protein